MKQILSLYKATDADFMADPYPIQNGFVLANIGAILAKIRIQQNKSLRNLASLCEVDHSTLYRIEKGLQDPKLSQFYSICYALGHSPQSIISRVEAISIGTELAANYTELLVQLMQWLEGEGAEKLLQAQFEYIAVALLKHYVFRSATFVGILSPKQHYIFTEFTNQHMECMQYDWSHIEDTPQPIWMVSPNSPRTDEPRATGYSNQCASLQVPIVDDISCMADSGGVRSVFFAPGKSSVGEVELVFATGSAMHWKDVTHRKIELLSPIFDLLAERVREHWFSTGARTNE